jgi:hypothetical protein
MEKKQTRRLYVNQVKSGAKPLAGFANLALALGVVIVVLVLILAFYEVFAYIQVLTIGLPILLSTLFIHYFCKGFATIVKNAEIQKTLALDKAEKEGLIIYEREG